MALQENRNMDRITIIGGGTTGYLAAFYFSTHYPEKQFTWVYPEENNPIGVGEALVPRSSHFISKIGKDGNIGITNLDIIHHCNGTLKLGIVFDGFNQPGEQFAFPFGLGEPVPYNATSTSRMMKTETVSENILKYADTSTHFRSTELLEYLDSQVPYLKNLTIKRESAKLEDIKGTYDFLIDCTGLNSKFSYLPDNYVDISSTIPNNCALVYRHAYTDRKTQCKPYSIFKAMSYGWIWNIPLGDQLAMGYVHHDKFDAMPEFISAIKQKLGVDVVESDIRRVKFTTGRCKVHLKDNVVRLGLASGFIEPLESTGIYLVTSAIEKITRYLDGELTEETYNNMVNKNFDDIINFIVAHYKYSKRDNEYWNHYKSLPVEKYRETEIFPQEAWDYILSGFDETVTPPKDEMDPIEMIKIQKGMPYAEWLDRERNATHSA
jgi:tryptophan halogenase